MITALETLDATAERHSGNPIAKLLASLLRWAAHRAASRALHSLDDRMLKDMGLSRSDIDAAVRGCHPARPVIIN